MDRGWKCVVFFLRPQPFFCGGVRFSVGGFGTGGDEGAEAFISRVGDDVDAGARDDVVVGYDNGGVAVLLMLVGFLAVWDSVVPFGEGCLHVFVGVIKRWT